MLPKMPEGVIIYHSVKGLDCSHEGQVGTMVPKSISNGHPIWGANGKLYSTTPKGTFSNYVLAFGYFLKFLYLNEVGIKLLSKSSTKTFIFLS